MVSVIYKLKGSLSSDGINCSNPFLLSVIISREHLKRYIMSEALRLFLQQLLQASIIASALWLIQENLKGTAFVCGKAL